MKILIAGLAKTGTTGLLYLIANSIGSGHKLLFEPKECPPELKSEAGDVIAKVLIGSNLNAQSFSHFDKKITIVRDPRDRIISALLYSQYHAKYLDDRKRVEMVLDILKQKESDPSSISVRAILEVIGKVSNKKDHVEAHGKRIVQSLQWFDDYVEKMPDGLLYPYETFVSGDYAAISKHLGLTLTGAAEVPERLNRVSRTKGFGDWRNWFTEDDVEELRPVLSPWLARYGYDPADWTLNTAPAIASEHCSGYFARLVDRQTAKKIQKAKILRAEPQIVAGWAIGPDASQPVKAILAVNGKDILHTVADKPRPGLKDRGVHPTGRCGFIFRFNPTEALSIGDRVTITTVVGDNVLDNLSSVIKVAAS